MLGDVSPDELAKLVPTLKPNDLTYFRKTVLGKNDGDTISVAETLLTGLYEFMFATGFGETAQRVDVCRIAEKLMPDVVSATDKKPKLVIFAEQRYVGLAGRWHDVVRNEAVNELPVPAVLLVTCDLFALMCRQQVWLGKLRST